MIAILYNILMKPKTQYKVHPKMQEILQQRQKRKKMLQAAYNKDQQELRNLKVERRQYMQENKNIIKARQEQIYRKKLIQTNKVKDQELNRFQRIHEKKIERLEKFIPHRKQLIESLRKEYQEEASKIHEKKTKIRFQQQERRNKLLQDLLNPSQIQFDYKNVNQGICVICLTQKAELMMTECKHLISCKGCQFVLRMNKKCPLCRKMSAYKSIFSEKHPKSVLPLTKKGD